MPAGGEAVEIELRGRRCSSRRRSRHRHSRRGSTEHARIAVDNAVPVGTVVKADDGQPAILKSLPLGSIFLSLVSRVVVRTVDKDSDVVRSV